MDEKLHDNTFTFYCKPLVKCFGLAGWYCKPDSAFAIGGFGLAVSRLYRTDPIEFSVGPFVHWRQRKGFSFCKFTCKFTPAWRR